ncbi:metallophosphoesterase family protein [Roseivivax sp. CAU 1753]
MKKTLLRTLLAVTSILVLVAATEGQILSLATSGVRTLSDPEPSDLYDGYRVHRLDTGPEFSVLAAGDIAECENGNALQRTASNLRFSVGLARSDAIPNDGMVETTRILDRYPDAWVLALGDLTYNRGEPIGFEDCYHPYWGTAKLRTWPVPGNHEYLSTNAYGYFDYWRDRAGPDRAGYYALLAGNWLVLSLNSEVDASPGSAQANWLGAVVAEHPDSCIAAFYHRPAYSTVTRSGFENARHLFGLLADQGARLVLNGHNHFYERTRPLDATGTPSDSGTVTFVVGAGGKSTSKKIVPADVSERLITGTTGVLKLDFTAEAVAWSYLTGTSPAETDGGTLPCR